MKKLNVFVKKLQRSDDIRKRRWYIGSSIISMAVVLFAWGWYVSAFVVKNEIPRGNAEQAHESQKSGILYTFSLGWKKMSNEAFQKFQNPKNSFGGAIGGIAEKANETNDIVVDPAETNFYFNIEEVPTSSLPIAPAR